MERRFDRDVQSQMYSYRQVGNNQDILMVYQRQRTADKPKTQFVLHYYQCTRLSLKGKDSKSGRGDNSHAQGIAVSSAGAQRRRRAAGGHHGAAGHRVGGF